MSYQVLARKWRPRNFKEMVGQETTLRMLMNALDNQRLHHAYLFTGTRGVGKTTLARILAKCLNCETGITSQPCGTCNICQSIDAGKFLDLIEVDAASRTKVEDTREILDNVHYSPTQGRYKIYLIDEVHMLSGHSFNALLKTLEEPPAHVKFLLATTDPKRLPVTILSRCLQFNLKRVPIQQISQHLQYLCQSENISFEIPALNLVAKAADGSMRDALSLLDQAIAYCGEKITTTETNTMLGSIEQDVIFRLLNAIVDNDGKKLLDEINLLAEHAPDFQQILEELLSILHRISITQIVPESSQEIESISTLAKRISAEDVQLYYQIALIGRKDLSIAPCPQQGFEMLMLRMLAFKPLSENLSATHGQQRQTDSSTQKPTQAITQQPSTQPTAPQSLTQSAPSQSLTQPIAPQLSTQSTAPQSSMQSISSQKLAQPAPLQNTSASTQDWISLLSNLGLTGITYALASNCTLTEMNSDNITLSLSPQHESMRTPKIVERIEQALQQYLNKPLKLTIKLTSEIIQTPAKQKQQQNTTKQQAAVNAIQNDIHVKKIEDLFDAKLDIDSIKALDLA